MTTAYEIDGIKFTLEAIRNAKSVRVDGKAHYEIIDVAGKTHKIRIDKMTMLRHLSCADAVDANLITSSAATIQESSNVPPAVLVGGGEREFRGREISMIPALRDTVKHDGTMVN